MRGLRWAGASLALVLLLSACGSAGDGARDAPGGPVPEGGTLRIAVGQAEPDLNNLGYKTHSFGILDQVYEPLVRYGQGGQIVPGLAERWDVAADGLSLTFHLRAGVEFSDGTAFTSEVAKADMQRWMGVEDHAFLGVSSKVSRIDTPDPQTLILQLDEPYYPALQELTVVRPVRFRGPASFDAAGTFVAPIGTGPYKLESASNSEIVLVRNNTYWGGRPNLDMVVFVVIPSSQARLAALKAGEVDIIGGDYLAPLAPEETLSLKGSNDISVLSEPSSTNLLLAFNTATGDPALKDPKVREAINLLVDRGAYAATLFHGLASPATQLFPASIPFAPADGTRPIDLDVAAAKALLGGAAPTLRLILDEDLLPQAKALSQAIQADLAKGGVKVQIDALDSVAYSDKQSRNDFDLRFFLTYGPPYDPFALLNSDFRTRADVSLFASPALDGLIDAALATTNTADRAATYNRIWQLLGDAWAVAPILETPRVWAVSDVVRGFALGPTEYDLPLQSVGVSR